MMIFLSQTNELIVGIYLDWFIAQRPSAQPERFLAYLVVNINLRRLAYFSQIQDVCNKVCCVYKYIRDLFSDGRICP